MPVHILFGDNLLEMDEAQGAIRRPFESADVLTFDGRDVPLPVLSEAALTAGLFSPERLVIVHDLHERIKGRGKDGELDEFRSLFGSVPDTTTLLLVDREITAEHPLVHAVREVSGKAQGFITPRKQDLPRWVAARGKKLGAALEPAAAELLAELVGGNPLLLESELNKLATYAGPNERITPSMVELLVGAVPQDSIFALVDAIAVGDEARALNLLHAELERSSSGGIDVALQLIRLLARQMRILLRIRLGAEAGRTNNQLISELKIPRYFADRYFKQARRLSKPRLIGSFELLADLEQRLKTGRAEAGSGLDLLVSALCT